MNKRVFMVMPFSNESAKNAYHYSIKKICKKHKLQIRRADDIFSTTPIYDDIIREIQEASIVVVDITDNNPNVYYELGIAHILKKNQTIIITQMPYDDTPFDIAHFRIIHYSDTIEGKDKLEKDFDATLRNLLSDYKTINRDYFMQIIDLMISVNKIEYLAVILGFRKYQQPFKINDNICFDFSYKTLVGSRQSTSYKDFTGMLFKMKYLKIENEIFVSITPEGVAFSELVEERGIKCLMFNDEIYEPDYIPKQKMEFTLGRHQLFSHDSYTSADGHLNLADE